MTTRSQTDISAILPHWYPAKWRVPRASHLRCADDKLCLPSARGGHAFRLTPRAHPSPVLGSVGEGIEGPIQVVYLSILLSFLVVGAYLVVRQVLARRELEEAAKVFGDRVRSGEGSGEVR